MKHLIPTLCLALFTGTVQAQTPNAVASEPVASASLFEGGVRMSAEAYCLEPGHPQYTSSISAGNFSNMRSCIAAGGRRALPRDTLSTPGDTPLPFVPAASTAQPENPVPLLVTPTTVDTQTQDAAAEQTPAAPKAPRGIELTNVPSYSENPQIFRPPAEYIGRGPDSFLP